MNLKQLIKEVESDLHIIEDSMDMKEVKLAEERIFVRKQIVEAVDKSFGFALANKLKIKDWKKLKKLLGIK